MNPRRFVIVVADFRTEPSESRLKELLDRAIDWAQVTPGTWILWTSSSPKQWYGRFKPLMGKSDHVFIAEVNADNRGGFMPRAFWEFIRGHSVT